MRSFSEFVKTTLKGGVLFLVPLVLVALVLRHALSFVGRVAKPVAAQFPDHAFAGVTLATLISAMLLVLLSFAAGLMARTNNGRRLTRWFENSLLGSVPQYQMMKTLAEGLTKLESDRSLHSALVNLEDGWQIGYYIDKLENGWVAVFIPQAPTPMSGNIMYLPAERVRQIDLPVTDAILLIKRLGLGSNKALRGVDMSPPAAT